MSRWFGKLSGAARIDLVIHEGKDHRWEYVWQAGSPPTAVDLTGWTAELDIRATPAGKRLLRLTTENGGIKIADQQTDRGAYAIEVSSSDTEGICVDHEDILGVYELVLISPPDDRKRRLQQWGRIVILAAVTRDETP